MTRAEAAEYIASLTPDEMAELDGLLGIKEDALTELLLSAFKTPPVLALEPEDD
jgi:hypothetical protein